MLAQESALFRGPIHIPKDKLFTQNNFLSSKTKYITQFYRELGGTIWVDKQTAEKEVRLRF